MIYKNYLSPPPASGGNYMTGRPVPGTTQGFAPTPGQNSMDMNRGQPRDPKMMYAYRKMMMARKANQQGGRFRQPKGNDKARGLGQAKAAVMGAANQKRAATMPAINPVKAAMEFSVRDRSREQGGNNATRTPGVYVGGSEQASTYRVANPLRRLYGG